MDAKELKEHVKAFSAKELKTQLASAKRSNRKSDEIIISKEILRRKREINKK